MTATAHMTPLSRNNAIVSICIGVIVFVACLIDSQFAWRFNQGRIERQIYQIAEIYLDGLVASIKASAQAGSYADVDRRLKSAFTEQSGIKELTLIVFDGDGRMTNVAGRKTLVTDEVSALQPGSYLINLESKTVTVSRRFADNKARATAILDIEFVLKNYNYAETGTIGSGLFAAITAGIGTMLVLMASSRTRGGRASVTNPSAGAAII